MPSSNDVLEAKQMLSARLLTRPAAREAVRKTGPLNVNAAVETAKNNVHAVGIGHKIVNGLLTDVPCVRVYVVQKLPISWLPQGEALPETVDGVPTDIIESPPAFLFPNGTEPLLAPTVAAAACTTDRKRRQRPVVGGISAAHFRVTAGTISCFCRSTLPSDDPSRKFVLSNNHVFADVNRANLGDDLFQPGPLDGGTISDKFAELHRFVSITLGGINPNRVDAAIGRLMEGIEADPQICSIGQVNGTREAEENMKVCKHGRTTGFTEGFVFDASVDAVVGMDHNDPNIVALFQNQLRINVSPPHTAFGLGGDSGSLVLERLTRQAIGLYFAGPPGGDYGLANRIDDVLVELSIQLL